MGLLWGFGALGLKFGFEVGGFQEFYSFVCGFGFVFFFHRVASDIYLQYIRLETLLQVLKGPKPVNPSSFLLKQEPF